MIEAGKKFRHLVSFASGQPTGDLTYTLYDQDGDTVLTDTVSISSGQLSYTITIPGVNNTLSKPLFETMTLEWEYDTATEAISENISYVIHDPIGFPVTKDGVRAMLGVTDEEVPDKDISLFEGYINFLNLIGNDTDLSSYKTSGDYDSYQITKAIEASAALLIFPSIQIRLPKIYDSGTSSYERWTTINWEALLNELTEKLYDGAQIVDSSIEIFPEIDIFVLSDRGVDPITGA